MNTFFQLRQWHPESSCFLAKMTNLWRQGLPWGSFFPFTNLISLNSPSHLFLLLVVLVLECWPRRILGETQFTLFKNRITYAYKTHCTKFMVWHFLQPQSLDVVSVSLEPVRSFPQTLGWQCYHLHLIPYLLLPVPSDLDLTLSLSFPLYFQFTSMGKLPQNISGMGLLIWKLSQPVPLWSREGECVLSPLILVPKILLYPSWYIFWAASSLQQPSKHPFPLSSWTHKIHLYFPRLSCPCFPDSDSLTNAGLLVNH